MMIARLILRTQGVRQNALKNFFSSLSIKSPSQTSSSAVITESKYKNSSHGSLYRRISPVGDPNLSIVPVLDQWVSEGSEVDKDSLHKIIKSLMKFRRFKHALEVSNWMTDKRYIPPTSGDIRDRLHLIYKVYGLEKAEEFYNNISQVFKVFNVDVALLNIYSLEKSLDKAEALMQKIRETRRILTPLAYNILLNLYYNTGHSEKMDELFQEMESNGFYGDKYSFTPRLRAYADNGNIEGLNKIMNLMKADPRVGMDCNTYLIAANAFLEVGLVDKSSDLLKDAEKLVSIGKDKYKALNLVLRTYAKLGKKDKLYKIWKILEKNKIYNMGYRNMISSLVTLDDIEGAERIFKEWETKGLSYDFSILNDLIDACVKKGELGKAKIILYSGIEKGGNPNFRTWYCLMIGYFEDNQVLKGVEALKNATSDCRFFPNEELVRDKLVILYEYLERKQTVEEIEGFMNSLVTEGVFSSIVCGRLLDFIKNKT